MLVTFCFSCVLEQEGAEQKIGEYNMVGNVHPTAASQILQQLLIMDAVKMAKEKDEEKKLESSRKEEP